MRLFDRIGFFRGGRMTLGACVSLALVAVVVGLVAMLLLPVTPPDSAFSARVAAWRNMAAPAH